MIKVKKEPEPKKFKIKVVQPKPEPEPKKFKIKVVQPKPEPEPVKMPITKKPPTQSYLLTLQKALQKFRSDPEITHYTYEQLEERKRHNRYSDREKPDPKKMTPIELKQYKYEQLIYELHRTKEFGEMHSAPDAEESELSKLMRYVPEKTDAGRDAYVYEKFMRRAPLTIGKYDIQVAKKEYDNLQDKLIKEEHWGDLMKREKLREEFKNKHLAKRDILPGNSTAEKYYTDSMKYIVPKGKTIKDLTQTQINYCAIYTYSMMHGLIPHGSNYDLESGKKLSKNDFTKEMKRIYKDSSQDRQGAINSLNFNTLQPLFGPVHTESKSVIKQAFTYGAGFEEKF